MGFVDRGGGREAKGASLRRSKKNPGAAAARVKTETKGKVEPVVKQRAVCPVISPSNPGLIDCSVAYLSRKFDADRDRLLQRAAEESNVVACLTWCGEVERQEALLTACREKLGHMYCAIGVHPDNVDRTNKKAHQGWAETAEQLAMGSACVAFLGGLDLTREQSTHFPQESLLTTLMDMASKHNVPLVAHVNPDAASADRFAEIYTEALEKGPLPVIVFHDAAALATVSSSVLALWSGDERVFGMISSHGLFSDDATTSAYRRVLQKVSLSKMLLCSDSPWHTPQNIEDEYLRTLSNEPANLKHVVKRIVEVLEVPEEQFIATISATCAQLFFVSAAAVAEAAQLSEQQQIAKAGASGAHSDDDEEDSAQSEEGDAPKTAANAVDDAPKDEGEDSEESLIIPVQSNVVHQYSCVKCRATLFTSDALVTHSANAPRATFKGKKTESGHCDTALFLRTTQQQGVSLLFGPGENVSCKGCGCKMGSVGVDAACPCGTVMCGSTCRVVASRVDRVNPTATNEDLLSRAANERETIAQPGDSDGESGSDDDGKRRKRKPKQNVKANNRSNMSHFRNKNWAPGLLNTVDGIMAQVTDFASKGDDEKKSNKKKKKGCRGQISDDDD